MTEENNLNNIQETKGKVKKDVEEFKNNIKVKFWENIPVIGGFAYQIRTSYNNSKSFKNGLLRQELSKWTLMVSIPTLGFYFTIAWLSPWLTYAVFAKTIKEVKIKIDKN